MKFQKMRVELITAAAQSKQEKLEFFRIQKAEEKKKEQLDKFYENSRDYLAKQRQLVFEKAQMYVLY